MKKIISLLLVICAALTLNTSVAEEDILGEWYANYYGLVMTMTLNADGDATIHIQDMGEVGTAAWVLDGSKFALTEKETGNITEGEYKNEKITLKGEGAIYEFKREPITPIRLAEVNPEAASEEFEGKWEPAYIKKDSFLMYASEEDGITPPLLTIKDSTLEFTEDGEFFTYFFGTKPLHMSYENGKMNYLAKLDQDLYADNMKIQGELLQDGMLKLTVEIGDDFVTLYNKKVNEEPAQQKESEETPNE